MPMNNELKKFEIGVYNATVREAVKRGEPVKHLDKSWADVHWITMRATSKEKATTKAAAKFPAESGYVIVDIVEGVVDKWD